MTFWDKTFGRDIYHYGTAPNQFLTEHAHRLSPNSTILVPGDGEGRNGVWLAQQGHHVLSTDLSIIGLEKTRQLAEMKHVSVQTQHINLETWQPEPCAFDAVVLIFVHLPSRFRTQAHRRLLNALTPQGLLFIEAFTPQQLNHHSGGPQNLDMLYTLPLLHSDFEPLADNLFSEEREIFLDEGYGHQGLGHVVRGIWQRK